MSVSTLSKLLAVVCGGAGAVLYAIICWIVVADAQQVGTPLALSGQTSSGGVGGAVDSVANDDGTLTVSPTTGAVVASLNMANPNKWTAVQNMPDLHVGEGNLTTGAMFDATSGNARSQPGTISVTHATMAVTGSGTLFQESFQPGQFITLGTTGTGESRVITAIASDTSMTVGPSWGTDYTGTYSQSGSNFPLEVFPSGVVRFGTKIYFSGAGSMPVTETPTISACGTSPSVDSAATNASGTVTAGGGAVTSCTVTFASAYISFNHCRVDFENIAAGNAYSYTLTAITVSGSTLGGGKFDYFCDGL